MRHRLGLLLALAAVAALPASASAAPDFKSELSADTTTFKWEGVGTAAPVANGDVDFLAGLAGQASPTGCDTALHDCDYTLLEVKHLGDLTVTAEAADATTVSAPVIGSLVSVPDIDVYVYKSNAAGEKPADAESLSGTDAAGSSSPETFTLKDVQPGFYLIEVSFYIAEESSYTAEAKLATLVPPTPATPAPTEPAPTEPAPTEPAPQQPQQQPAQQPQQQPAQQPQQQPAQPAAKGPTRAQKVAACKKKANKKFKGKKKAKKRKAALKKCSKIK